MKTVFLENCRRKYNLEVFYVGIDFGATNIRAAACDKGGKEISEIQKKPLVRKETAAEEMEVNVIQLVNQICREKRYQGKELGGIGVAMAALFNRENGVIISWPNNSKYQGFPIQMFLEERYGVPVVLEDDANAAALGEQFAGAGIGLKDFVYVTVSTGIGSGIIVNDHLLTGFHGWAGELGHIKVTDDNIVCSCGARGCLQSVASGPAILHELKKLKCYESYHKEKELSLKELVSFEQRDEEQMAYVFEKAGRYIGGVLANLVMLLDVPVIILGGGVIETGDLLVKPIKEAMYGSLENKRRVKIVCSHLKDKNGAIGALCLIDKYRNKKGDMMRGSGKMSERTRETVAIINGPNINILGIREPDIYGKMTWQMIEEDIKKLGEELGVDLIFYQSNHEGSIVDFIQEHLNCLDGVVINPAAFTKTGYSILDALTACDLPFVEVHLSNINARGGWHTDTIFASKAVGHINGFQGMVYRLGLEGLCYNLRNKKNAER